jgi:methyl-accepting chemotaxis protein
MGLRLKFNLILLLIFAVGFVTFGITAMSFMERTAIEEARQAALLALDTTAGGALSGRTAQALASRFVETSVRDVPIKGTLSPIDSEIVSRIDTVRNNQVAEVMTSSTGTRQYVAARAIQSSGANKSVRIASVNLDPVHARVKSTLIALMSAVGAVFFAVFFALNIMVDRFIVRPIAEMAKAANAVSIGDFSPPEFATHSNDEIGVLGTAFNRLRRSTQEALKLLKNPPTP